MTKESKDTEVVSGFISQVKAQEAVYSSLSYLGAVKESNILFYSVIEKRDHARQRQSTTRFFSAFS